MVIPTEAWIGWFIGSFFLLFVLCTVLEIRFRKKIRLGLVDESKFSPERRAEIKRIRERMEKKTKDNVN